VTRIKTFESIAREHSRQSPITTTDTVAIDQVSEILLDQHTDKPAPASGSATLNENSMSPSQTCPLAAEEAYRRSSPQAGLPPDRCAKDATDWADQALEQATLASENRLGREMHLLHKNIREKRVLEEHLTQYEATLEKIAPPLAKDRESISHLHHQMNDLCMQMDRLKDSIAAMESNVEQSESCQDHVRELKEAARQNISRFEEIVREKKVRLGFSDISLANKSNAILDVLAQHLCFLSVFI